MGGATHDHECAAAGAMEPTAHILTDQNYGRAVILESPPSSSAVVRIMRAWPAPAGASPDTRTYGQYGIIHDVPSERVLHPSLADGSHKLSEVVPWSDRDDMRSGGYDEPFVAIHPPEPDCPHAPRDGPRAHSWGAHWRVVGGFEDRPGVFPDTGKGGGLLIKEHCTRPGCHATKTRETRAVDDGHDAEHECYIRITYGELPAESKFVHDATYGPNPRVLQAGALKLIPDDGEYHDIGVEWSGREYLMACTVDGANGDSHVCPGARRIQVYGKIWTGGSRVISVDGSGRYTTKPKVAGLQLLTTFCDACGLEADAHPDIAVEAAC